MPRESFVENFVCLVPQTNNVNGVQRLHAEPATPPGPPPGNLSDMTQVLLTLGDSVNRMPLRLAKAQEALRASERGALPSRRRNDE
jgi:hypothetical protein